MCVFNVFHLKCIFSLKKIAVPIIIFREWMPHWMPLKKTTRWVSEGCPPSTEWEVIERGFGGCARARGRIWRVSPGRVPPSKATYTERLSISCLGSVNLFKNREGIICLLPYYLQAVSNQLNAYNYFQSTK